MSDWRPIKEAHLTPLFTVAELRMASGRVYRATWKQHGRAVAWWPDHGQARLSPIALYEPIQFRVLATGIGGL